jgi:hypothetical protein
MDASVASRPKRGPDFLPAIPLIPKHSVRFTVVAASWFAARAEASLQTAASAPSIAFLCNRFACAA